MTILDAIIELRGGFPEKCDFCGQPYNEHRHPTPDEGGEWACTECWARWDKKEAAIRARGQAWVDHSDCLEDKQAITAIEKCLANDALEKKAENARELGLDYD